MAEAPKDKHFAYEIIREGEEIILRIDVENYTRTPSIEDDPMCMARTVDILSETGTVTKIIFAQKRDYEYDYEQTEIMNELARIYTNVVRQRLLTFDLGSNPKGNPYYVQMQNIVFSMLKSDPLSAYIELKRIYRHLKLFYDSEAESHRKDKLSRWVKLLNYLITLLDKTRLVAQAKPYMTGFKSGDREVYRRIFAATIKPDFMYTKLMANYPSDSEELDSYEVGSTEVTIFKVPDTIQYLYHIMPPEFKLTEEKYELLDMARNILADHKPKRSEFIDPERMRQVFFNVGRDLLGELSDFKGIHLKEKDWNELTEILVRYTVGFGLVEVLLQDEKVQDITINSPMGQIPIFIVHQDFEDCRTNIYPTPNEAESWASKLRLISGRPLDEANPILDTELDLPGSKARIAVISPPLNPVGIAFAFRRHRDKPWTLPLFVKQRFVTPLAAGVLSFIIDGSRTMLVAGTRSAGKSSLLGSLMVEIMRKYRIITIEDTLELPTDSLRKLGYNIQPMKVASAIGKGGSEIDAETGIRTTLRLGDSCLIVGEVRSTEATALYEAMRVGALANVVAGTIHGDSPYGVFDRVVNDLKVPRTSFKATDIIVVANPIKSADGMHRSRRVTQITEVRKFWEDDPLREGGFGDLLKYNPISDQLEPTRELIQGESDILKAIAGNVREWAGNWDAVWGNINLRADIKKRLVDISTEGSLPEVLEAKFVIQANDEFHRISDAIKEEVGALDNKRIYGMWNDWVTREVKKLRLTD
jgi:archaeal flagellar protein FlaI